MDYYHLFTTYGSRNVAIRLLANEHSLSVEAAKSSSKQRGSLNFQLPWRGCRNSESPLGRSYAHSKTNWPVS